MKRFFRYLTVALVLIGLVALSTFQVAEGEAGIVMRFGKPQREAGPGLHFKLPAPFDNVVRVDLRVHVLDPESAEYLTRDKKNVVVDAFMAWRVEDVQLYARTVKSSAEVETRLTDVLRSVLNDVLSTQDFSALISAKPGAVTIKEIGDDITHRTHERARKNFGIAVPLAVVKRVNFPGQNKNAVYSRMEADRKSLALGFRSEGEEEYKKIEARTDRQRAEMIAAATQKAAEIRAGADAEVKRIFAEAATKDPELWELIQQLEIEEAAFGEKSTLVLPPESPLLQLFRQPPKPLVPNQGSSGN